MVSTVLSWQNQQLSKVHTATDCTTWRIGVWAQSTLGGGTKFLPEKYVSKISEMPEFTWFLPEKLSKYQNFHDICPKIYKIPEFYIVFARKMPEFYVIIARKIFFPNFRGHVPPLPPISYALTWRASLDTAPHDTYSSFFLSFCHVHPSSTSTSQALLKYYLAFVDTSFLILLMLEFLLWQETLLQRYNVS